MSQMTLISTTISVGVAYSKPRCVGQFVIERNRAINRSVFLCWFQVFNNEVLSRSDFARARSTFVFVCEFWQMRIDFAYN